MYGIVLLVATAVLWSSGGLLIKWVQWHPLAIAGTRSAIASLVILACFRGQPLQWSKAQGIGAIGYAGTVMLFVTATKWTTAANAILLQYTAPLFVAVLGHWLLGERTSRADWMRLLVICAGMALFFVERVGGGALAGNLCAVGSGFCMGLFTVYMRAQRHASPYGSVLWGNIVTFLVGLPFIFSANSPGMGGWAALLVLGIFQLGLSYVLYSIAIKHVTALEAMLITIIEPLLNPLWVFLLLGEAPGWLALVGGGVIMAGVLSKYIVRTEGGQ